MICSQSRVRSRKKLPSSFMPSCQLVKRRLLKKDQLRTWSLDFYVRAVSMIYNAQVPFVESNPSEAVELLDKAVARDPNFFLAYCQLAFAHDLIGNTPERLALAKLAIDSAFRLRPDSGEAHLALALHLYL